jgi:trehalose-6-phosphatase
MRQPGATEWENLAEKFDMGWQKEVLAVFQKYTDRVPGKCTSPLYHLQNLTRCDRFIY